MTSRLRPNRHNHHQTIIRHTSACACNFSQVHPSADEWAAQCRVVAISGRIFVTECTDSVITNNTWGSLLQSFSFSICLTLSILFFSFLPQITPVSQIDLSCLLTKGQHPKRSMLEFGPTH